MSAREDATTGRPRRWGRIAIVAGVILLGLAPWWGPAVLRPLAFFRVRHIEVRGARYASPADIARALKVDTSRSLWDDTRTLELRAEQLPEVRAASISRDMPSTLVVQIEENVPIALAPTPTGMKAYDEEGRALQIDPSRTPMDLPVISRRDTAVLRLLGEVRASDPSLFARISELRRSGRDELLMQLVTVPVRMMDNVTAERLSQISSVEEDLSRRHAKAVELDLRYRDQVIARIQ